MQRPSVCCMSIFQTQRGTCGTIGETLSNSNTHIHTYTPMWVSTVAHLNSNMCSTISLSWSTAAKCTWMTAAWQKCIDSIQRNTEKAWPGSCDWKCELIWFLYPLILGTIRWELQSQRWSLWVEFTWIKLNLTWFVCDACVCLFKEQEWWGSSESSLKLATCVAAPCQP